MKRAPFRNRDGSRTPSAQLYDRHAEARMRAIVFAEEPNCMACGTPAQPTDECDHIIPVARAPHLHMVRSNRQRLCRRCHATKTARVDSKPTASRLRPREKHPGDVA